MCSPLPRKAVAVEPFAAKVLTCAQQEECRRKLKDAAAQCS
jgi:hypothetical protein